MATTYRISPESRAAIKAYLDKVLEAHIQNNQELTSKMDEIDVAYARYKASIEDGSGGVDKTAAQKACDVFATDDKVTPPLVVSQVDTFVGYLSEVFLSGYPIFPVLSTPKNKKYAEQLETLMDDHALLGGYPRHLLMFLRDSCKYNYAGIEVAWDSINQFNTVADYTSAEQKLKVNTKKFNKLKRLNPRNIIRDCSVLPGEVAEHGDYAGYIERISMIKLKQEIRKLQEEGTLFNGQAALDSGISSTSVNPSYSENNFVENPQISEYVSRSGRERTIDWDSYLDGSEGKRKRNRYGAQYERVVVYARILPADFALSAPQPRTPQIWKFIKINDVLISAARVVSAYDYLPVLIGQPIEDGFAEQTQSIAESQIPFQQAAGTLYNIRFAAARRAVSDRALYNSNVLDSSQVNSKAAAPKIPVNISPLASIPLDRLYHQIPFDLRGTETAIQDANVIANFGQQLSGINNAQQGMFQRGNKSVAEWNGVMNNSDNRMRLPALTLEYQVFAPMRSLMVLNIFQYGEDVQLVSQKTKEVVDINVEELRKQVLSFRTADGYTPKAKMASTDMLAQGIQLIGQSQALQASYGQYLPDMFAHLMSLGGVRGLEEYSPTYRQEQQNQADNADPGLPQTPIQPPTELP